MKYNITFFYLKKHIYKIICIIIRIKKENKKFYNVNGALLAPSREDEAKATFPMI